jgi:hypothetical protein
MGIGPVCRKGLDLNGVSDEDRCAANKAIHRAGVAAQSGSPEATLIIIESAREVEGYGLTELADKLRKKFVTIKVWRDLHAPITRWDSRSRQEVRLEGTREALCVQFPYSPSANDNRRDFIANRSRPVKDPARGFYWQLSPKDQRNVFLWLSRNFGGHVAASVDAEGGLKTFRIPKWEDATAKYHKVGSYWVAKHSDNQREAV